MSRNQIANGIANSSGMVGRNLMDHPQYLSWGLLPDPVFPYRGPLVTSAIGDLCDGAFRSQRAAFRISLGNEAWSATVGGIGGDPQVTTLDFINGMNVSGLNRKDFTQLADDDSALFGADLTRTLGNLISRQFRIAFPIEQSPDPNNRVTLSSVKDALNLPRPRISYDISDYTKQGIVAAFHMKELIFRKLGAIDFTKVVESDPGRFNDPRRRAGSSLMAAPVISWAPIGWAMIRKHRSSIRGNAHMTIETFIWSEAARFRPWEPPIRRSRCRRWHCGPRKASSRNSNCTSNDEYRGTLTRPFSKHIRFRGRRQATYCNSEEEFNAVVAPYMTVVGDTQ